VEITLSTQENAQVNSLFESIRIWCKSHQVAVGVGEMAVGAALITYAIQNGLINESVHAISAIKDQFFNKLSLVGGAVGGSIGLVAGSIIGSIGVVALGGAIGIPASIVAGGAAVIMSLAGYSAGDLINNFMNAVDYPSLIQNGSVFLIGLGLVIDGARRCISSEAVKEHFAKYVESTIRLSKLSIATITETSEQLAELASKGLRYVAPTVPAALAAAGVTAWAASSLAVPTVLGSTTLGTAAVSLGIISTPILPIVVVAGGAALVAMSLFKMRF
jgi:hypothetical protein